MFARFDENTAMTLGVIKETKRYGRTHANGQRENSILTTNKVCGGYNNYLKAKKNIHNKILTHENKNRLTSASKLYKKKMNFHINKLNRLQQQKKLRKLHDKNPKQYWKILNSIDNKDEKSDIELDTLFEFFKDLNKSNDSAYDDQIDNNINVHIDEETDDILNYYITENEIIKGIKSLKNNKVAQKTVL